MTIRPIDLQTNFSQMHEVGRMEQARNSSLLAQQALMDDQAAKQANLRKERVDESEKTDQTNFRDALAGDENKGKKDKNKQNEQHSDQDEDDHDSEQKYGKFLDVIS